MFKENFCNEILKKALSKGGEYADVFFENKLPLSIHLEDNKIEKIFSGTDKGAGIRVVFNGKSAYAYTNELTRDSLFEMALSVSKAARGEPEGKVHLNLQRLRPHVDFNILKLPGSTPLAEKLKLLEKADTTVRKLSSKIRQVSIGYGDVVRTVTIANSEGGFCEDERVYSLFAVNVISADGDIVQTGSETLGGFIGFELFDEENTETIALTAAKRALMMLKAKKIKGGRMPVVISSKAGGTMIHEAIGHGLEADIVQQGLSVYSDKRGEKVASHLITVIDDGTMSGKRGSYRFDDEGSPSQKTVLVERGKIKGYMYDRITASKDGVSPTGNGRRESYRSHPIPRMTNTYLASGESSPQEIIRSVPYGLFVKKMGGGQVNTVTGDFVFEVPEGYLLKDGEITEPVRGATLTGNGPEILKSIDMVASDLGFSIGTCGKDGQGVPVSDAMPTVRIPEIVVGGET